MRLETRVFLSQEQINTLQKAKDILETIYKVSLQDSDLELFSERAEANLGLVLGKCQVEE